MAEPYTLGRREIWSIRTPWPPLGSGRNRRRGPLAKDARHRPRDREVTDHAEAIAELALRIRDHVGKQYFDGHRLRLRIGINSGAVVAGIIGTHKFSSDLWATPSTRRAGCSRRGAGEIQTTSRVRDLLGDRYVFESRGQIEVKGRGQIETFILEGWKGLTPGQRFHAAIAGTCRDVMPSFWPHGNRGDAQAIQQRPTLVPYFMANAVEGLIRFGPSVVNVE